MNAFLKELIIMVVFFGSLILVSTLAFQQGHYEGLAEFCPSKELYRIDGIIRCGSPEAEQIFLYDGGVISTDEVQLNLS